MFVAANQTAHRVAILALAALGFARAGSVPLYLNVETDGQLISGLTAANFRVYEDGQPRPFHLEKPEEPASIALLVENSRASWSYAEDLVAAMQGFARHAPEGHWYALATYSHEFMVQADFTQLTGEITQVYSQLPPDEWNEVDSYDAVYEMLDKMGRMEGRRILIVIGSGFDTFSEHTLDDVKKKLESENVTVFVAAAGSALRGVYEPYLGASRMTLLQSQAFLQMLAEKSGGFAWFPNQSAAYPSIMQGIMQSIASQYKLVYETGAPAGKLHKIKVEAFRVVDDKREDFKVLVRAARR